MRVKITDSFSPITEAELQQFEAEIGYRLPDEYRRFLLKYNGGKPDPKTFNVNIDGFQTFTSVTRFAGLTKPDYCGFDRLLKTYTGRIPRNLLPIACELSVDLICISIAGDDYEKVYLWDHNWEVTEGEPDYSNVHHIADSFEEFLEQLY